MVIHNHITKCSKRTKAISAWVFYPLCWTPPNQISYDDRVATCVPLKLVILTCIEPMLLDVKKFLLFVILKFDASMLMLIVLLFR